MPYPTIEPVEPKRPSVWSVLPAAHGRGHVAEAPREDEAAAEHGLKQGLAPLLGVQSEEKANQSVCHGQACKLWHKIG